LKDELKRLLKDQFKKTFRRIYSLEGSTLERFYTIAMHLLVLWVFRPMINKEGFLSYVLSYFIVIFIAYIFIFIFLIILEFPNRIIYRDVNELIEKVDKAFLDEYEEKLRLYENVELCDEELIEYFRSKTLPSKLTLKVWKFNLERYKNQIIILSGALGGGFVLCFKMMMAALVKQPGLGLWIEEVITLWSSEGLLNSVLQVSIFAFVLYNFTAKVLFLSYSANRLELLSEIVELVKD